MPDAKHKQKVSVSRDEAGRSLLALANALVRGENIELEFADETVSLPVGEQVGLELEVETEGDRVELEIELTWPVASAQQHDADPSETPRPSQAQ